MGLEHAQNAGGRVVREIAFGDRPPFCTPDRQVAAYLELRGRKPEVVWDGSARRPLFKYAPWDEEIDRLLWEYQQPFTLQVEGGPDVTLYLPELKDRIRWQARRMHGRVTASEKDDKEAERRSSNGDPAGG